MMTEIGPDMGVMKDRQAFIYGHDQPILNATVTSFLNKNHSTCGL